MFEATHEVLLRLVAEGLIDGLRVDHPDGLADPRGYLRRLAERTGGALGGPPRRSSPAPRTAAGGLAVRRDHRLRRAGRGRRPVPGPGRRRAADRGLPAAHRRARPRSPGWPRPPSARRPARPSPPRCPGWPGCRRPPGTRPWRAQRRRPGHRAGRAARPPCRCTARMWCRASPPRRRRPGIGAAGRRRRLPGRGCRSAARRPGRRGRPGPRPRPRGGRARPSSSWRSSRSAGR